MRAFLPLRQITGEMDRLMTDLWRHGPESLGLGRGVFPALNVWEADEALWVEAELPGVRQQDVEITVIGEELTIKGERPAREQDGATQHRQERGVGEFSRQVDLPFAVDADHVEATLADGVLMIKLPKADVVKPRTVEIKTK